MIDIVDEIAVGIPTLGIPRLRKLDSGLTLLENMLIGKDFHWQRELAVTLPGRVELIHKIQAATDEVESGRPDSDFSVVNYVPMEKYLECVVGSEMNPAAPLEFLKAHAIISRSWAVGKVMRCHPEDSEGKKDEAGLLVGWDDTAAHSGFHVCSDDHCQRYQGIQPVSPEALDSIRSTAGIVLTDVDGKIVDARFSKCCGGMTELFSTCWQDREMPGLDSFTDPWCDLSVLPEDEREKVLRAVLKDYDRSTCGGYRWQVEISKREIENNLLTKFNRSVGQIVSLFPEHRGPSGRISLLRIEGEKGTLRLGKELWIRRLLSASHLYSSAFEINDMGETLRLHGRGWGHGVGLCQIGAARMALEGATCEEILGFYYPRTKLSTIDQLISKDS